MDSQGFVPCLISEAIPKLPTPSARSKEHEAPRVQEMPKAPMLKFSEGMEPLQSKLLVILVSWLIKFSISKYSKYFQIVKAMSCPLEIMNSNCL